MIHFAGRETPSQVQMGTFAEAMTSYNDRDPSHGKL
jgi:hypothetical protein